MATPIRVRHAPATAGLAALFVAILAVGPPRPAGGAPPADDDGRPRRIVSLNLCTDILLLHLADRDAVASVTYHARDPELSPVVALAMGTPVNHGRAEEILGIGADLVLTVRFGILPSVALLRRQGLRVVELETATGLEAARRQVRDVAAAVGERVRGERLVAEMDRRIAAVRARAPARRPVVAVYQENGFTIGPETIAAEVVAAAGFDNVAERLGIRGYGQLALERLIMVAPEVLILGRFQPERPSLADQIVDHPALRAAFGARAASRPAATIALPSALWNCGGPQNADAAERLVEVARSVASSEVPR